LGALAREGLAEARRSVQALRPQALEQGDRTIMIHRGEILADLSGNEREGLDPDDLVKRFSELRFTVEFAIANRPPA
jgi:hypothetical protein